MRKISGALPKTIAAVRIATSVFFLLFGQYKIFGPEFTHGGFQEILQSFIQNSACRPYKRTALQVFFVARLFAHQHDPSACASFTEDGMRAQLP